MIGSFSLTKKHLLPGAALLALLSTTACVSTSHEIDSRGELSTFNDLMDRTGVSQTVDRGGYYTIFVPTNEAFSELNSSEFPCIYNGSCPNETAELLRQHIVRGEVNPASTMRDAKTLQSRNVYSINNRLLHFTQPRKGEFMVEDAHVLSSRMTATGMLYVIDRVIASESELNAIRAPYYAVPATVQERTTVRERVMENPYGDVRSYRKTITTTSPDYYDDEY